MANLKITEYDRVEQEAISEMPNRIIEAFMPFLFQQLGYPTRVRHESELFKYIDVMHELRFESDFVNLLGGLTAEEFELLCRLTERICGFSESQFQRRSIARASVLRSINVLRHIKYLFGSERPRVFEIGSGCGYLGAMLMLEGYPYAATDVTQAFYLYQNHLWDFISDGKVIETVNTEISAEAFAKIPSGAAVHFPWWEFVKLRPESVPQFDIVTCNHALCEMHPDSLRFTLKITQALLRGQDSPTAFVFEGWGYDLKNSIAFVTEIFYQLGFVLVHYDPWITVFTPAVTERPSDFLHLPKPVEQHNLVLRDGRAVLEKTETASYEPEHYTSPLNPLSTAISWGRQGSIRAVEIDQVNRFYTGLLESEDHLSPDEHFWKLINRPE